MTAGARQFNGACAVRAGQIGHAGQSIKERPGQRPASGQGVHVREVFLAVVAVWDMRFHRARLRRLYCDKAKLLSIAIAQQCDDLRSPAYPHGTNGQALRMV
jgi:hypothetical protein